MDQPVQQQPREGAIVIQSDGINFSVRIDKLSKLEVYAIIKILHNRLEKEFGQ